MARRALILANGTFKDAKISRLESPAPDARRLANLLKRKDVGGYEVTLCVDPDFATARIEVQKFFEGASHDDMNLILISGHGIKDRWGKLHFASADTDMGVLRASSLASRYVIECMDESDAAQQILFIDTCYSGAFAKGMVNKAAMVSVSRDDFGDVDAKGKAIITASTSVQLAGEGKADGSVQSVFTRHLIAGIETGAADNGGTGQIRLNALFDYVRSSLKRDAPGQTPQPFYYGLDGSSVVVALNPLPKVAELPEALRQRIESSDSHVKGAAVDDLYKLAVSDGAIGATAITELQKLKTGDSIFVQGLAERALDRLGVKNSSDKMPDPESLSKDVLERQKRAREEALVYLKDHVGEPADITQKLNNTEYNKKSDLLVTAPQWIILCLTLLVLIGFYFYKIDKAMQESALANAAEEMATEAAAGAENAADASMEAMGNATDAMAAGADSMAMDANMAADPMTNSAVDAAADAMKK